MAINPNPSDAFYRALSKRHTVLPPQFLPDRTLELNILPYSIAFTNRGDLVVLGGHTSMKGEADGDVDREMRICIAHNTFNHGYDLTTVNTGLTAQFEGLGGIVTAIQCSVTTGSDDLLYVSGYDSDETRIVRRFDSSGRIADQEDLEAAIARVDRKMSERSVEIHQVVESAGRYYFVLQGNDAERRNMYAFILVADRHKVHGGIEDCFPYKGMYNTQWEKVPRACIYQGRLIFKMDKTIVEIPKAALSESGEHQQQPMIPRDELDYSCIASNHCMSNGGVLYVVTQMPGEPRPSMKGYKDGALVTHVSFEHPVDTPAFSSMAISKDGTLAYSNLTHQRVYFYQIRK